MIQHPGICSKYSLDCLSVKKLRPDRQIFKHTLPMSPANRGELITESPFSSLCIIAEKIQTNPKSPTGSTLWINFHAHYSSHFGRQSAWLRCKIHAESDLPSQGRQGRTLFISVHFFVSVSYGKILDPVKSLKPLSRILILPYIKYLLITKGSFLVQGQSVPKVPSKAEIIPQGARNHHKSHYLLVQSTLNLLSVTWIATHILKQNTFEHNEH